MTSLAAKRATFFSFLFLFLSKWKHFHFFTKLACSVVHFSCTFHWPCGYSLTAQCLVCPDQTRANTTTQSIIGDLPCWKTGR